MATKSHHLVTVRDQTSGHMGADQTASAYHKDTHDVVPTLYFREPIRSIEYRDIVEGLVRRTDRGVFRSAPHSLFRGGQTVYCLVCTATGIMTAGHFTAGTRAD